MENKDKGDGIEDSPLDILLVFLLEGASIEVLWLVTPSSKLLIMFFKVQQASLIFFLLITQFKNLVDYPIHDVNYMLEIIQPKLYNLELEMSKKARPASPPSKGRAGLEF